LAFIFGSAGESTFDEVGDDALDGVGGAGTGLVAHPTSATDPTLQARTSARRRNKCESDGCRQMDSNVVGRSKRMPPTVGGRAPGRPQVSQAFVSFVTLTSANSDEIRRGPDCDRALDDGRASIEDQGERGHHLLQLRPLPWRMPGQLPRADRQRRRDHRRGRRLDG